MTKGPRSWALVILLTLVSGSTLRAQARRIELDGLVGYTVVPATKWAGFTMVDRVERTSGGVLLRGILAYASDTPIGIELGTQQLFVYELRSEVGTIVTTERHTVAGFHLFAVGRFFDRNRVTVDGAAGFRFLGDVSGFGMATSVSYAVLNTSRFRLPVGARVDFAFNEPAIALTTSLKAGVSMRLGR